MKSDEYEQWSTKAWGAENGVSQTVNKCVAVKSKLDDQAPQSVCGPQMTPEGHRRAAAAEAAIANDDKNANKAPQPTKDYATPAAKESFGPKPIGPKPVGPQVVGPRKLFHDGTYRTLYDDGKVVIEHPNGGMSQGQKNDYEQKQANDETKAPQSKTDSKTLSSTVLEATSDPEIIDAADAAPVDAKADAAAAATAVSDKK